MTLKKEKKSLIYIYKLEEYKVIKKTKYGSKIKKIGVLLGFRLLVHQLSYQVFFTFQSCFKFQLLLK